MPPTKKRKAEDDGTVDLTAEEGTPTNDADSNVAKKSSKKPATKKPAKKPKVELPDIIPQSDAPRAEPPGTAPPGAKRFKCVCWNVAGLRALLDKNPQTLRRIADVEAPDVICLQEHKLQDVHVSSVVERLKTMLPEYRTVEFAVSTAKKGYSGVAILARAPITPLASAYVPISAPAPKSKPQGTLLGFVKRAPDAPTPSAADPGHVKLLSVKEGMYDFKSLDGNAYYASEYTDEGRVLTLEFDAFNLVLTYVPNSGQKLERLDYRLHDWDVDFRAYLAHLDKRTGKPVIVGGDL